MGIASERLNGVKQSGSRMIREPTWYFQSKLLVSYSHKDNMTGMACQENKRRKKIRNLRYCNLLPFAKVNSLAQSRNETFLV